MMKLAFVVYNELFAARVMEMLKHVGIDYYTCWHHATGKGKGTEPHLGAGAYGSTNDVLMIAFTEDAPFRALTDAIAQVNAGVLRPDDRVRLFQVPLEHMV